MKYFRLVIEATEKTFAQAVIALRRLNYVKKVTSRFGDDALDDFELDDSSYEVYQLEVMVEDADATKLEEVLGNLRMDLRWGTFDVYRR